MLVSISRVAANFLMISTWVLKVVNGGVKEIPDTPCGSEERLSATEEMEEALIG